MAAVPAPDVTVVIPTRDRPAELARALSAVLGQRDVDLELVVVDDGSAVPAAAGGDPRVRLVRLERSGGVSAARNRGLAEARGRYVSFLDDDDLWAPERLARMCARGDETGAGVVVSGTVKVDDAGRALSLEAPPPARMLPALLRAYNVLGSPSGVVVRRSVLERTGGFDPAFSVLADWELWLRLAAVARVEVVPELLTGYVVHGEGMHHVQTLRGLAEFDELARRLGRARRVGEPGLHDERFVRWAGGVHRRAGRRRPAARAYWRLWRTYGSPRDLARTVVVLVGERAMAGLAGGGPAPVIAPPWVARYRAGPDGPLVPLRPS